MPSPLSLSLSSHRRLFKLLTNFSLFSFVSRSVHIIYAKIVLIKVQRSRIILLCILLFSSPFNAHFPSKLECADRNRILWNSWRRVDSILVKTRKMKEEIFDTFFNRHEKNSFVQLTRRKYFWALMSRGRKFPDKREKETKKRIPFFDTV